MGRSGLSSRRKHSKKKSLKVSSEVRRKKRSSRNKSKKLPRHDDSFSSDDDASTSSSLVSSSSSDGEYRSRRARSHTRNEGKGSRKRSRRRSLSEESSKDPPDVKKRKGSKKKADSQKRKKNKKIKKKKKKKLRSDAYISSASSDSTNCSTCDGDSSSDEGPSLGRRRGRSRETKKDRRDSIKGRNRSWKNRSRPRSSSSPSNSYDDECIEKVMAENNSRRLKSVITFAKLPENDEGDDDMKKDQLKEEIVYDYDDYPSGKSNDSNDGESKKELVDRFYVSPEKRRILTSVIGEVNSTSSVEDNKSISECVGSKQKESNASGNIGSEVDNLELILRQKALENLSRFRGGLQTKTVVPVANKGKSDESGVKQSTSASFNLVHTPSGLPGPEQDGFSTMAVPQPVVPRSRFTWRRDPLVGTGKEEKAAPDSGTDSGRPHPPAPKSHTATLSSTRSVGSKIANETLKVMANTSNSETNDGQKATTALETPSCGSTKEDGSKKQQTETNNSQFEQKTMSVMRGGEMVQVSYKVYIPNRAPALARRQLKR